MDPLDVAPADARTHAPDDAPTARLGKRARHRLTVEAEILRVAREHLATDGAAALSLRAVARDLGMVSSGIYRYVESRDELLVLSLLVLQLNSVRLVGPLNQEVDQRGDLPEQSHHGS